MKMFANENLFEPIIDFLRELDNVVLSIREAGLSGIPDDKVYQLACEQKRVIITMDKDFSKVFRFPPEGCGGIIVVKIYKRTVEETLKIFRNFYQDIKKEDIAGNLVIVTPEDVRIRRPRK